MSQNPLSIIEHISMFPHTEDNIAAVCKFVKEEYW